MTVEATILAQVPWLRQYLGSRLDPDTAEDALQATLMAALRGRDRIRGECLGSWITGIARHKAIDEWRRTTARSTREERFWRDQPRVAPSAEAEVLRDVVDPVLLEGLAALPAHHRRALLLRAEGATVGEVASALGVSYKGAEMVLLRARKSMIAWMRKRR